MTETIFILIDYITGARLVMIGEGAAETCFGIAAMFEQMACVPWVGV